MVTAAEAPVTETVRTRLSTFTFTTGLAEGAVVDSVVDLAVGVGFGAGPDGTRTCAAVLPVTLD